MKTELFHWIVLASKVSNQRLFHNLRILLGKKVLGFFVSQMKRQLWFSYIAFLSFTNVWNSTVSMKSKTYHSCYGKSLVSEWNYMCMQMFTAFKRTCLVKTITMITCAISVWIKNELLLKKKQKQNKRALNCSPEFLRGPKLIFLSLSEKNLQ